MIKWRILLIIFSLSLASKFAVAGDLQEFKRPLDIPFDQGKSYSLQLATVGKMLFFDPRLSGARNFTCASCHNPSFGFEAPVETSVGAANTRLGRQAPTVLNAAWTAPLFWDGRAATLEDQAAGPITAAAEMNGDFHQIVRDLKNVPEYVAWFEEVFPGEGVTDANILTAIATYERTIVSPWSPFDRWVDGDEQAVSVSAKRGFELFTGKANCSGCHTGWNFTDNQFHDIGLETEDIGRAAIDDSDPKNVHAFKTPSLRNTLYRAPYMHNGKTRSMDDVILHYIGGGIRRPSLSDKMHPLDLSRQDVDDLIAFLRTLTAEQQDLALPTLPN